MKIPNEFPSVNLPYKLAIVGEAPGEHEVAQGRPFCGPSGNLLNAALQNAGIMRSACYVGNVCQVRPPGNKIEEFDKQGWEIQEGLTQLRLDLNKFNPNCVLLLGSTALWATQTFHSISSYRGTLFNGNFGGPFNLSFKSVSTYHPAAVFRNWDWAPLFNFDVARAAEEAKTPELVLPQRKLDVRLTVPEILHRLSQIKAGDTISVDIEGGVPNPHAAKAEYRFPNGITCVSIAVSPFDSFIIPFSDLDPTNKRIVLQAFAKVMADPEIFKIFQNGLYDYTVIAWVWKIPCRGIIHDTMLSGWEVYPELPKGLGVQTSLWTKEPYYKFERKIEDKFTHYEYCCKDSAVTYEIHEKHLKAMTPEARAHYDFNMELIPALQFMSLRGTRYDLPGVKEHQEEIRVRMLEFQTACNTAAGKEINLNSSPQMCQLLYRDLHLEPQYMVENGKKTNKLTANADACLKLAVKSQHPFLSCYLAWKKLEGIRKQLNIRTDPDGRIRCSYNLVGAETGRLSCQTFVTGSGYNLQTIIKGLRKHYKPDPGYHYFQCDLEGADGWTVAARCAEQGDPTMMDDYLAGIKPAKVIAVMHLIGAEINQLSRADLKKLIKETTIPPYLYDVCKVVQHGSNYWMGHNMMSDNVLDKSFKKSDEFNLLYVPPKDCGVLQDLYFTRYKGVLDWRRWVAQQLQRHGQLSCASGHTRTFFGRPNDRETIKQALAHEPQANTTYVTNRALWNLWHDPENRRADGSLIIEPLHSVHDALNGQFPIELTDWATAKIRSYFSIPIRIGNIALTIPFEGGYGPSWYETDEAHRIGTI